MRPEPRPVPAPARDPRAIAPAAPAACVAVGAGLVAGHAGALAGLAALAALVPPLARGVDVRGRVWAAIALVVGLRAVVAGGGAREAARAWDAAAGDGDVDPVVAVVAVEEARPGAAGRWSVRGTGSGCGPACDGAVLGFSWRAGADDRPPMPGERWRVAGRLARDPARRTPGARFPPPGLAPGGRRGWIADPTVLAREPGGAPILATAADHLERRIERRFGPPLSPLAAALLLGERRALDPVLVDAFATTGTLHLLAVSGLHVGFLAGLVALGLGVAGLAPRSRALAATALLAGYAALVGARPSVVRAAIMASLVLWARAGERRTSAWQAWGVAAMAVVAWRPLEPFGLGFPLSFGAVAGLLALGGPLVRALEGGGRARPGRGRAPAGLLRGGFVATVAATAGTLPVQAAAFGWLAPVGFALNPVVVPLAAVVLPVAWLALAADAIGVEALAGPLASAARGALALLAAAIVAVGEGSRPWAPGPAGWVAGAGGLLVAAILAGRRRPATGAVAAAGAIALLVAAGPPPARGWEVVWLDVGQGDAVAIHFPDGATWLVDAGGADPFGDQGRRMVLPYLRRRGVRAVDWLVATHPDLDHVGGAASVVRGIRVARWGSAAPTSASPGWLALVAARSPGGGPVPVRLRAGERLAQGGVSVDVLHPTAEWVPADPDLARVPANEGSVVLLLSRGPCRLLLTGDLGAPAEARLVERLGDSLAAGLLHVGHHGSRHSSTAAFLARVRPRDAVVSVGRRNRYGHPSSEALARLAAVGARVHRTDRVGAVVARCRADGWRIAAGDRGSGAGSRHPRPATPPGTRPGPDGGRRDGALD